MAENNALNNQSLVFDAGTLSVNSAYTFPSADGTSDQVLTTNGSGTVTWESPSSPSGSVVQFQSTEISAGGPWSSSIPNDNTIPQQSEGTEIATVTITPTNASSTLLIEYNIMVSFSSVGALEMALFQDSTANALCSTIRYIANTNNYDLASFKYVMTAGTTSATTFKVRMGGQTNSYYNRSSGSATFLGSTIKTFLTVTEFSA